MNIFPEVKDVKLKEQNLQIQTFGKRIYNSQTVQEYLLEFLVVFIGAKVGNCNDKIFTDMDSWANSKIKYEKNPNIGLKRFIFFDKTKIDSRFGVDIEANREINTFLKQKIDSKSYDGENLLNILRDLLRGFSMVTGNRGWFAQSLLPVCEEAIFCEAIGSKSKRKNLTMTDKAGYFNIETDKCFEFNGHNFLARGGETYYLHLIQGLCYIKENEGEEQALKYAQKFEELISKLIGTYDDLKNISKWVQDNWITYICDQSKDEFDYKEMKQKLKTEGTCQWISCNYKRRSPLAIKEMINLLNTNMNELEKINLLAKGIVFQILRMMSEAAYIQANNDPNGNNRCWLIHFDNNNDANIKIKKLAVESYKAIEEDMMVALANKLNLQNDKQNVIDEYGKKSSKTSTELLKSGYDDSYKLLRKLGKDIGLIIPLKGDNMRFTMSDDIIRFTVLSLIRPESKMTLDTFLEKLYTHFGITIGTKQYSKHIKDKISEMNDASFLKYNLDEFQSLLKKNGFLKELSDATAMVINPYSKM